MGLGVGFGFRRVGLRARWALHGGLAVAGVVVAQGLIKVDDLLGAGLGLGVGLRSRSKPTQGQQPYPIPLTRTLKPNPDPTRTP